MALTRKPFFINGAEQVCAASWEEVRGILAGWGIRIAPGAVTSEGPDGFRIDGKPAVLGPRDRSRGQEPGEERGGSP
jgi:hypothetical protein